MTDDQHPEPSERPADLRRRLIVDLVRRQGRVLVTELASSLQVASETVRRDLHVLESQGLLRRTHGAAHPLDRAGFETGLHDRSRQFGAEKGRIAEAAVKLLEPYETVFIDEGSTAMAVAERLAATSRPLAVITHSLNVAVALADRPSTDVHILGGRVRAAALATVGSAATHMLADFAIDAAVLSASGISLAFGLSTADPETAELKRTAMTVAGETIVVSDHTKFGVRSFCRYSTVEECGTIITDTGLPTAQAGRYKAAGTRLIRA